MMDNNKILKILKGIINNEYGVINEYEENYFIEGNNNLNSLLNEIDSIYYTIADNMNKEQMELLDNFDNARTLEQSALKKFYFKRGLISGLTNLSYLKEIDDIEYYINDIEF